LWLRDAAEEFESHIYGDHVGREPSPLDAEFQCCISDERKETAFRRRLGEGFAANSGLPVALVRLFVYEALINVLYHGYRHEGCGPVIISVITQSNYHRLSIKNNGRSILQSCPFSQGNVLNALREQFSNIDAQVSALWSSSAFELSLDYQLPLVL
jgi:hypothetical protein